MEEQQIINEIPHKSSRHRKKLLFSAIREQMEFYFSDANLSKDRFIAQLCENDPYIDLSVFLSFNKIRHLTTKLSDLCNALSKSEILQLSEDNLKVCRKTAVCVKENQDDCTIYVERLPADAEHDWLKSIFSKFGKVDYVSIPRYRHNKMIKGFAFVEFNTPESAKNALLYYESIGCKLPTTMLPDQLVSIFTFEPEQFEKNQDIIKKFSENTTENLDNIDNIRNENEEIETKELKHENRKIKNNDSDKTEFHNFKKQKKGTFDEKVDVSSNMTTKEVEENLNEGKKKKKERKQNENVEEQYIEEKDQTENKDETVERKKRKRKEKKIDEGQEDIDIKNDTEIKDQVENKDETPEKKKKKRKVENIEKEQKENIKIQNNEELKDHVKNEDKAAEKKKRNRDENIDKEITEDNEILNDEEIKNQVKTEDKTAKKKKRNKKEENIDKEQKENTEIRNNEEINDKVKNEDKTSEKRKRNNIEGNADKEQKEHTEIQNNEELKDQVKNEDERTEKKKRKRKRYKHNSDDVQQDCLQVLSKKEWKQLRNKYLNLQRQKMQHLKEHLYRSRFTNMPSNSENNVEKKLSENKEKISVERFKFTPGVIVYIEFPDVLRDVKKFKNDIKSHGVEYVDIKSRSNLGFIRFSDNESAKKFCENENISANRKILEGDEEKQYWNKIKENREETIGKNRKNQRGRDKLLRKAEKELGKHIRFENAEAF